MGKLMGVVAVGTKNPGGGATGDEAVERGLIPLSSRLRFLRSNPMSR